MKLWRRLQGHVTEDLLPFCDGTLPPEQSRRVSEHLLDCRSCRGEREEIEGVVRLLSDALALIDAPPGLWNAIESRGLDQIPTTARRASQGPGVTRLRPIASAVAVGILLTVGTAVVRRFVPPHRPMPSEPPSLQFDLEEYLRPVQAASREDSFQAIATPAPDFVDCESREALQLAGLSAGSTTPLPGFEIVDQRIGIMGQTRLTQLIYAKGQDAFCVFVAPERTKFLFGSEPAFDTQVGGIRCQKVNCPRQQTYVFGAGNFRCVLVSKSLDRERAAAIMRYFIAAHRRAARAGR